MSYLGQTTQITALHNGTAGTNWSYDSNLKDRRVQSITNTGVARGYQYITTSENVITAITETGGNATGPVNWTYRYDAADRLLTAQSSATTQYAYAYDLASNLTTIQNSGGTNTLSLNGLNQISTLNGTAFSYDANGNLVHDDQHTYQWDAENRLVGIGYNAQSSKQTTMRYDGLGRRIAITTTDGGAVNETRHLWCGETLCQARNSNDMVTRRYFAEGEEDLVSGGLLYYAVDHLGSVRDVLAAQGGHSLGSYDYDPYGNPTQTTGPTSSDFRYADMFYHHASGLYLTRHRAYDPRTARWLSRDPLVEIGEIGGIDIHLDGTVNLYAYVLNDPVNDVDPSGLSKTKGILKGDDPLLRELQDVIRRVGSGYQRNPEFRSVIMRIEQTLCDPAESAVRKRVLRAWIKLAKREDLVKLISAVAAPVCLDTFSCWCIRNPIDCAEAVNPD